MSYFINDNNFARDKYPKRMTRLGLLSRAVPKYASALSISGDMLTWAVNAYSVFMEQSSKETTTFATAGLYVVAVKGEETSAPSDIGYIDML